MNPQTEHVSESLGSSKFESTLRMVKRSEGVECGITWVH